MKKTVGKIRKILFCVIMALIVLIVTFYAYLFVVCHDFYSVSRREFQLPDIHVGFVPQGFAYTDGYYLLSGYESGSNESRIYVAETGQAFREVAVLDTDGGPFVNHAGGISCAGDYVYLAGCDGKCYVFSSDILSDTEAAATVLGSFETDNNADFCYIDKDQLYVGEYYYNIKYPTDTSHHMVTPAGDTNCAIMTVYPLDASMDYGVDPQPMEAYSIPEAVQGVCVTQNGEIALSASSGFSVSDLHLYEKPAAQGSFTLSYEEGSLSVPLYYLDSGSKISTSHPLPKSEGIIFTDGRFQIIFESASNKFLYGKLLGADYAYSFSLD